MPLLAPVTTAVRLLTGRQSAGRRQCTAGRTRCTDTRRRAWSRVKVCARDTGRWAFYDASRNRSGTWCSMQVCGNREKMRRRAQRSAG